ncbi:DegT/DnrJ/EryC1/StrS family aminotransferase [Pseudogracilibacillus sp. ICA-222130]|uniref:DegT/DnrJ/EryC1/StrS family aminotransferase n=1 Tax=Pseudogracilibacillus sp. ICA-222130 TaxID=3134655 RepID=UPI0030C43AF2
MSQDIKNISFSPPDITDAEIKEVVDTLKSGWLTTGPKTKKLEQKIAEYIGVNKAVCLNSATASMELTLRILGIGPGDEVITSAYTYTASASVIHHVGAKIILVDTEKDSYEMDYNQLENVITEKTKAIIPVDIAGKMCNYDRIFEVVNSKRHLFKPNNKIQEQIMRITVIADGAHSFGAKRKGKISGQVADFTCFSFHAVKNLTTAEGGAVVWKSDLGLDDNELYRQYMLYSLHGQSKDALSKTKAGSWEYDIVFPGYKCNMTDITASIGLIQLERYESLLRKRKNIVLQYNTLFEKINVKPLRHIDNVYESSCHLYILRLPNYDEDKRNTLISELASRGISTNVHYKPLPYLTAYKNLGFKMIDYPNAYKQYEQSITLPLHTQLTNGDIDYIFKNLNNLLQK